MASKSLESLLSRLRDKTRFVGAAVQVWRGPDQSRSAALGVRRIGSRKAVTTADRWHIGSITKPVTATLMARLADAGVMDFATTPESVFGGQDARVHHGWRRATIGRFLSHSAGAPRRLPVSALRWSTSEGETALRREAAVRRLLARSPEAAPGDRFIYSNAGYVVAGHLAEVLTGRSWERLVTGHVFEPLTMRSAGFGAPRGTGPLGQPVGHVGLSALRCPVRVAGRSSDYVPLMAPAATLHMTLDDLCRFGYEHLRGLRGGSDFLSPDAWRYLHTPLEVRVPGELPYTCGWRLPRTGAVDSGARRWHDGSNGRWYALLLLVPAQDAVFAFAANDGSLARHAGTVLEFADEALRLLPG